MTDLDSPKKNNDCYFYYYSTCAKGDNCTFRHEPSALGCETMCSYWKEGKCLNIHCNFRHMELRKNRKVIPCYWESQPGGCLKAHCPFMHQNPRPPLDGSGMSNISAETSMTNNMMNQQPERKVTAIDSLVVNFEEESDNESGPTYSPGKISNRIVKVKTLEEIRLEEIQAEEAAYYSGYDAGRSLHTGEEMRQRIVHRMIEKNSVPPERKVISQPLPQQQQNIRKRLSNDELASILGDESLRKKQKIVFQEDGNFKVILNKRSYENDQISITVDDIRKRKRTAQEKKIDKTNIDNIKIKTLEEIRAERNAKNLKDEKEEAEVTSTSEESIESIRMNSTTTNLLIGNKGKIKIRRNLPVSEPAIVSSNTNVEENNTSKPESEIISEDKLLGDVDMLEDDNFETKTIDEGLLLEVDDDDYDITLKTEEDLLNEVDD